MSSSAGSSEVGAGESQERLLTSLRAVVGPRWVLTSGPDKMAYGRDCWPRGIILARGGRWRVHEPLCVVQPGSEEEVVSVVRAVREAGVPVVPYGAGSGVCGGVLPDRGGVVVDVKRLSAVGQVDASSLLMRVGAGAIGQVVQTELERRGMTLGHFPSSLYCSSVGGYLAARSAGQYSSRFGKIEDMVQTLRLVTGAGDLLDTAPGLGADLWGGGLDLTQLVVGSEGTLGVITGATLRIHPAPALRVYRGFKCPSVEAGVDVMRRMMQAGLRPAVMRLYDEFDTVINKGSRASGALTSVLGGEGGVGDERDEAAWRAPGSERGVEGLPSRLASGLWETARRSLPGWLGEDAVPLGERVQRVGMSLLGRAIGQPLWLNQLTEVLPGNCLLVVGFEGAEAATRAEAAAGLALLRAEGADLGPAPGEHWLKNRFKVSYKQSPLFDGGAFVDTMEVSTTWGNLMRLYYEVKEAVAGDAFVMAHFSHAYAEGASIYFTFAGFGGDTERSLAQYERLWARAQQAVKDSGASVAHHHGVGLSKAPNVGHDHQGGRPLFEALKVALDPDGIMNPGKVWSAPSPAEEVAHG